MVAPVDEQVQFKLSSLIRWIEWRQVWPKMAEAASAVADLNEWRDSDDDADAATASYGDDGWFVLV